MTDTTGDRITKAVNDERKRIMNTRAAIETKIGWTSLPLALPTASVTITGGDPEAVTQLGQELAALAIARVNELNAKPETRHDQ